MRESDVFTYSTSPITGAWSEGRKPTVITLTPDKTGQMVTVDWTGRTPYFSDFAQAVYEYVAFTEWAPYWADRLSEGVHSKKTRAGSVNFWLPPSFNPAHPIKGEEWRGFAITVQDDGRAGRARGRTFFVDILLALVVAADKILYN